MVVMKVCCSLLYFNKQLLLRLLFGVCNLDQHHLSPVTDSDGSDEGLLLSFVLQ